MDKEQVESMITDRLNDFTLVLSEHLSQSVQGAVKLAVNGKVESMRQELREYIKKDDLWKAEVQPVVRAFENMKWNGKILLGIVLGISALAGAILSIKNLFKI